MRKLICLAATAAVALGLFAAPAQANACGAPGASGGTYVPDGGQSGDGAVYAGSQGTTRGWVGEESSRGYIEVTGDTSSGITVHGSTKPGTPADVSGKGQINPFDTNKPVSVCVAGGGEKVEA